MKSGKNRPHDAVTDVYASLRDKIGYSSKGGAVGGGCSGLGQYYIIKQPIIYCKPLHPVSTAPPLMNLERCWMGEEVGRHENAPLFVAQAFCRVGGLSYSRPQCLVSLSCVLEL